MRSLNKKVKALFLLISFAAYMPISIAPSLAIPADNQTPVIDNSFNGGNIGMNGTINVGDKDYNNFQVEMAPGAGTGAVGLFNWGSFDVGKNVAVNWVSNSHGQKFINRVMNTGKASEIFGALTSSSTCAGGTNCGYNNSGSVILINPNGITFGNGSQVNLNSFTASTRDIKGIGGVQDQIMKAADTIRTVKTSGGKTYTDYKNINGLKSKYGAMTPIVFDKSSVDSKGNGIISLDGSKFNHNETTAMSVALIGDKITVNNSTIQTYESNGTSGNLGNGGTRSSVKLITADSVELQYNSLGGIADTDKNGNSLVKINDNAQIAAGKTADDYGISITGNSKIYTGAATIDNRYNDANVNINDSTVYTSKMWNSTSGGINVNSNGSISLVNSRFESMQGYNSDTVEGAHIGMGAGNIDITAKKDINIDNTRIASAPSDYNNGLAHGEDAKAGNITIKSKEGSITVQKSAEAVKAGNHQVSYKENGVTKYLPIDINSKGNLTIEAKKGNVITKNLGDKTHLVADHNVYITGKNVDLNTGIYASQQGNLTIKAEQTGGGIKVNDAVLFADKGTVTLGGKETSLIDTTLDYGTLNLYNDYNQNNNVLIKDGTTFYDRKVASGEKDTLVIETSGDLIIDHNELKKADFNNRRDQWIANPSNQTANVKLASKNGQVTIRNNSNITLDKNIEINAKTNANVSNSNITSNNGDVTVVGGSKVTIGTSILTAGNTSNITAGDDVAITNSKVISTNANTITSKNGKTSAKGAGTLIQSTAADVTINQSKTANLDNDYDQAKSVKAAGNINFNVKGSGQNINSDGTVGAFSADKRLVLNTNNNIDLVKTGDWTINRTDMIAGNNINVKSTAGAVKLNDTSFNSNNNTITAKTNVDISKDMAVNKGKTTITADGNVKTNADNGTILTKGNKLIVNAKKDIDIAFTGVNNKTAGLEINSNVNTSNDQIHASNGNSALEGRNVKLNAKDKTIAIAKVKADTLEIVDADNVKLLAATDNKPNAATDNIGPNGNTANVGTAYIEVRKLGGWNMDENVSDFENIPGFYQEHYDLANEDGNTQRHFLQFEGDNNFLLVYQRATQDCDPLPDPDDGGSITISGTDLRESSVVRLPRHEEGVSAVAPVLNEITDPTANVIMAAARITLDEENETDEDGDAIQ